MVKRTAVDDCSENEVPAVGEQIPAFRTIVEDTLTFESCPSIDLHVKKDVTSHIVLLIFNMYKNSDKYFDF